LRSRSFIFVVVFLVLLIGGAVGVYAYDHGHRQVIAKGVRIAGVDVGGLHPAQALARLRHRFLRPLARPVVASFHGQRFVLTARAARIGADLAGTVDEAVARSREGSILARVTRSLSGGTVHADLQPRIVYSHAAVVKLARRVGARLDRPAQDARVSFSGSSLGTVPSHTGMRVGEKRLVARVESVLRRRHGSRRVAVPADLVRPKVSTSQVAARYSTVVTIDRANFRLHLFKQLREVKSYPIAVGRQGLETPAGLYPVVDKQVNPSWHVPKSSWAGSLAGQVIPPGPRDPIKARWIGITGGAGIHGTEEAASLGSAASHGCIRMAIPDVIELYPQVPYGSLIYVA
jgi:lipoprotein-anchoring transpeptidase ErfK/SrfK